MFLELFNDLFVNSSIFYFYFGVILATIGISQLIRFSQYSLSSRYEFSINEHKSIKVDLKYMDKGFHLNESFIIWFVKSFKRIDKLDDDKEDNLSSYFNNDIEIRGGQLWRKIMHSPTLKSTV